MERIPYWPLGSPAWVTRLSLMASLVVLVASAAWSAVERLWVGTAVCLAGLAGLVLIVRALLRRRQPLAVRLRGTRLRLSFITTVEEPDLAELGSVERWRRGGVLLRFAKGRSDVRLPLGPGSCGLEAQILRARPDLDERWPHRSTRAPRLQYFVIIAVANLLPVGLMVSAFVAVLWLVSRAMMNVWP